ncbi:MAG: alpha-glucan family phosphorylase [Bacteroidales bacterium]|jgi:phosphorylase/glycogen(starch) synthase|nr:alpha-glucan family phosphorylase [Bacteroidales bacterium]
MKHKIDYLFETSWEVCNKVGGIYTVLSTKALTAVEHFKDNYICIGPDLSVEQDRRGDFIEDSAIFKNWREVAHQEGLHIRVGRWNVKGLPLAILIDFTPFFEKKNEIFTQFWLQYKLDSLSGQWDYIEPALFGYAAGKVIESFYNYYGHATDGIAAHFHEWMTGTGVLYLEQHVPQIATAFTTHATVLGRCAAGNGIPLYDDIENIDPTGLATRFGVMSKQSLELLAAHTADVFTTVSEITGQECVHFLQKQPDVITVNGFENDIVPHGDEYRQRRTRSREQLFAVAEALTGQKLPGNTRLLISSGRYEFTNKGIDIFIRSLSKLREEQPACPVVAFIAVPSATSGIREDLLHALQNPKKQDAPQPLGAYTTHHLSDPCNDPIIRALQNEGLNNNPESPVKVIFVPVYLNGRDGIFNLSYYDFFIGFDLSIFPSYYEPWGYTPLESVAFGIPTITTTLSGFGQWTLKECPDKSCVQIIARDDHNSEEATANLAKLIHQFLQNTHDALDLPRQDALDLAHETSWQKFYEHYLEAYYFAIEKSSKRHEQYKHKIAKVLLSETAREKTPLKWRKLTVKSVLPPVLDKLSLLSRNLWWTWNTPARELFEDIIGKEAWREGDQNPVLLLQRLPADRIRQYAKNEKFIQTLNEVYHNFETYMNTPPPYPDKQPMVAYFSMEYGLTNELKIFSGGLGMLAGDYLKEASDQHLPMIGVGLLYREGYFRQQVSREGIQESLYPRQSFSALPIQPVKNKNGEWETINIALPGRDLYARIWLVQVGQVPLYLLDTDFGDNREDDRSTTATLYGGDHENRLKQELLLGVGGIRLLKILGINPDLYHLNEGHAAFISLERLRDFMEDGYSLPAAQEMVRATSLFTTHTPVPAGHDAFQEDMMRVYFAHYPDRYHVSWNKFMSWGRSPENKSDEKFSMSVLACRFCQEVNGVSKIHGRVSREMFAPLYDGFCPEELHIGYVTNGVHYPTWAHEQWKHFFKEHETRNFSDGKLTPVQWQFPEDPAIDEQMWTIKKQLRADLMKAVTRLLEVQMRRRNEPPELIVRTLQAIKALGTNALTIGFARRFATYKRAHLLFSNEKELLEIVHGSSGHRPVTFIFAGKAHPHDKAGQDLIKRVIEFSRKPEFLGHIIFLENYDMNLAKKLVSGCDVWLNTPTRPLEASGTSGEKAAMNGVLNLSVLDGWWAEGYTPEGGWALPENITYGIPEQQDELDAVTLYEIIKKQIIPAFFSRKQQRKYSTAWTTMMRANFQHIATRFTMKRQVDEYYSKFYLKLFSRSRLLLNNDKALLRQLITWKNKIYASWDNIEVMDAQIPDMLQNIYNLGETLRFAVTLRLGNLTPDDIRVELVITDRENEKNTFVGKHSFSYIHNEHNEKTGNTLFTLDLPTRHVGVWSWAIRLTPTHPLLPHDQDMNIVRWV